MDAKNYKKNLNPQQIVNPQIFCFIEEKSFKIEQLLEVEIEGESLIC